MSKPILRDVDEELAIAKTKSFWQSSFGDPRSSVEIA